MSYILSFLHLYNDKIIQNPHQNLLLNIFSEFNDPNIIIQDGPLACYCSHVRGMIYGYLNFSPYTIIVEDDFHINDIDLVIENLPLIPSDWDVICFGAQPINKFYSGNFYKFTDLFHSTHFYIIRNSSIKTIFANIYPINDQIDILLSRLHNVLNIYNIPNSIIQKNYETNTQNNLHVIYNSPNYEYMRIAIENIKSILHRIIEKKYELTNTKFKNITHKIALKILFDVIFTKISRIDKLDGEYYNDTKINNIENSENSENLPLIEKYSEHDKNLEYSEYSEYFLQNDKEKLRREIYIIIDACIKGINVDITSNNIIDDVYNIIEGFDAKNNFMDNTIIPLNYGSTSNIFICVKNTNKITENLIIDKLDMFENLIIIKSYNKNIRWTCISENVSHCDYLDIYDKEVEILSKLSGLKHFAKVIKCEDNKIYMEYAGETLFDNFNLPDNWKEQIERIFNELDTFGIYYPEFNLKNICVYDGIIYFIDFGLAKINANVNISTINLINQKNFIELIDILREKFITTDNPEQRLIYYNNFINNVKLDKNSRYKENIF